MNNLRISISGIIGVGKTTFAENLAAHLSVPVYYEEVKENKYLEDFYIDMKRYAFPLQIYLLNQRFVQQQQINWTAQGSVQDRSIYEDLIFAKMLHEDEMIEQRDYETYLSLFDTMLRVSSARPDLIIHLDISAEESLKRIRIRGRECEKGITVEYLEKLKRNYDEFIIKISQSVRVVKVNWSEFSDIEKTSQLVMEAYQSINKISEVW